VLFEIQPELFNTGLKFLGDKSFLTVDSRCVKKCYKVLVTKETNTDMQLWKLEPVIKAAAKIKKEKKKHIRGDRFLKRHFNSETVTLINLFLN
jgi:hypothetical protein